MDNSSAVSCTPAGSDLSPAAEISGGNVDNGNEEYPENSNITLEHVATLESELQFEKEALENLLRHLEDDFVPDVNPSPSDDDTPCENEAKDPVDEVVMGSEVNDSVDEVVMGSEVSDSVDEVVMVDPDDGCTETVVSAPTPCLDFSGLPFQITGSWKEFEHAGKNNFTKGCKWSPDGSCILSCSEDAKMRLFNLPMELYQTPINWACVSEMTPALYVSEAELIYDYCWYPRMSSLDPVSCCFASSCRYNPVHMWDAFTGELRCTYRPYNHVDEIVSAHSLGFDTDAQKLYCGFKNMIRVFDVPIPGRNFTEIPTCDKKGGGQRGIISCFAFCAESGSAFAAGSYNRTVGIYSESDGTLTHLLDHQAGGITHLCFSPDGRQLYSGGRKDSEIQCWDMRNLKKPLFQLRRICNTNQRLYFEVSRCGQYVVSGNQNGVVTAWDVKQPSKQICVGQSVILEPVQFYQAHDDCVNGISLHPNLPLLATSSGQRKFPEPLDSEGEENEGAMFTDKHIVRDNSIRLWWIGHST